MGPIRPARSSCCCSPRLMRRMDRRFATERCRAMSPRERKPQSLQSSIFVLTVAKRRVRAPHCISARKDLSCLGHPRFRQPQRDGMTITVVTSITGAPGDGCDGSLGLTGHRAREAGQSPDQSNPSPQASRRPGWGHAPNCAPASIAVRCPTWHTYRIVTAWKCVEKQKALRCLAGPCLGVLVAGDCRSRNAPAEFTSNGAGICGLVGRTPSRATADHDRVGGHRRAVCTRAKIHTVSACTS